MKAHVIVIGNEKGGSGKSTLAMHIIAALMNENIKVGSLDLDLRQGTLSRYIENRLAHPVGLKVPNHVRISREDDQFQEAFDHLIAHEQVVVIDTPGHDSALGRCAHRYADTLITPLNDSFIDLDVLARVDARSMKIERPSHYAETVWEQRKKRMIDKAHVDWIVLRNRLSHLDARNKRDMEKLLAALSKRIGFRLARGFGERVIYRELFLKGLTMMDLKGSELSLSHLAARQEVRALIETMNLRCFAA